jgi:sec-independent protein translocase protein TatC
VPLTIKGRPIRFSLKWLKPPPTPPDGSMTLFEHLKELRYRLVVASLAIIVATIVAFVFSDFLFDLLIRPYTRAIEIAKQSRPDLEADLVIQGATAPFTVSLKISLLAGLILSAPVWLYQIWAFIVPGLLAKEKKWTLIVVSAATPLFLAGIALGYYVMPKGIAVLINFTPDAGIANLQDLGDFLSFMTRLMIVFGLAFEVPLFILMLNVAGVLPAKTISKYRSYIIFGLFIFAAIATPTPDAVTMILLAAPMIVLVVLAEVLAHAFDRAKLRKKAEQGDAVVDPTAKDTALKALEADGDRSTHSTHADADPAGPPSTGETREISSSEPSDNGHRPDSSEAITRSQITGTDAAEVERDEDRT